MALWNYVKPVWRNGSFPLTDAPPWVVATIERTLASRGRREEDGIVRLHDDRGLQLTVAWIQCTVSLRHEIDCSVYRTGRYLHAIALDAPGSPALDTPGAHALFETVYGPGILDGVASHEAILERVEHPEASDVARQLFLRDGDEPAAASANELQGYAPTTPRGGLSSLLHARGPNPVEREAHEHEQTVDAALPEPGAGSEAAARPAHDTAEAPSLAAASPASPPHTVGPDTDAVASLDSNATKPTHAADSALPRHRLDHWPTLEPLVEVALPDPRSAPRTGVRWSVALALLLIGIAAGWLGSILLQSTAEAPTNRPAVSASPPAERAPADR